MRRFFSTLLGIKLWRPSCERVFRGCLFQYLCQIARYLARLSKRLHPLSPSGASPLFAITSLLFSLPRGARVPTPWQNVHKTLCVPFSLSVTICNFDGRRVMLALRRTTKRILPPNWPLAATSPMALVTHVPVSFML